jgi:hypothetical protein
MIEIAASIENNLFNTLCDRSLRYRLTDASRGVEISASVSTQILLGR